MYSLASLSPLALMIELLLVFGGFERKKQARSVPESGGFCRRQARTQGGGGGGGGGSPLPMNPPRSFKFVSKSTACALTACEHVFAIDQGAESRPCFIACACDVHSTFKDLIVAECARPCSSERRVADCAV